MTDADTDGALYPDLAADLFLSSRQPLVEAGRTYIALPPPLLQDVQGQGQERSYHAWTDGELDRPATSLARGLCFSAKGLRNERRLALGDHHEPETCTLIRVTIEDSGPAPNAVSMSSWATRSNPRRAIDG